MEAKSDKNTPKKFSFRKRRGSKGKKENESTPVALETDQEATKSVENCEPTPEKSSDCIEQQQTPEITAQDEQPGQSSGEELSPKADDSPPSEGTKKKKSKRRSLFKRSGKKNTEKVDDCCEPKLKDNECTEQELEASEATVLESIGIVSNEEQVVCEVPEKPGEITDQSDGEGYLSVGEASEAEGETFLEEKGSSPEAARVDQGDKGTKRKSFFKRGLSLKRRKPKKQTNDSKEETATTEQPCEAEKQTEATLENSVTTSEADELSKTEKSFDASEDISNESKTDEQEILSAVAKKYPPKPPRKVSFVGPDGTKLESSDEGDSLTEHLTETGDESDDDTITAEDDPSELLNEVSEIVVPEVVIMSEDTGCAEPATEVDDDDLTEVSSMSSSLLASSDAPDTISTSDASRLFVFTDTEDTGSRITLEGISEESETEFKPEVVNDIESESKCEVTPVLETESKPEEDNDGASEMKDENEAAKLLGGDDVSKLGEWEMVNKSYDMSVELQRVRKQTLFGVKRLCCSVM